MHKVKRIEIRGFKRLKDVDLEMRPLTVMIGANGVGKTSLLDAVTLLAASAEGQLYETLSDMGGISEAMTKGQSDSITLGASIFSSADNLLTYSLTLSPMGQSYRIFDEELARIESAANAGPLKYIEKRNGIMHLNDVRSDNSGELVDPIESESVLSQIPKTVKEAHEFQKDLTSLIHYHTLDLSRRAPVKLPQQLRPASHPGADGENLVPFLFNMRETERERFETIEDTLKTAFTGFEQLNFPSPAAGMLSMTWKEKNFASPLYMHQLSEGTLRFLWLISLLQSPGLSTITMIDEPETSLHPELLSLLADLMREATQRTHLIVATQSDTLIRFLEPKEVVVMDIGEDGFTHAIRGDELGLDEWLKDYSLDEVWRMGRMGGRA